MDSDLSSKNPLVTYLWESFLAAGSESSLWAEYSQLSTEDRLEFHALCLDDWRALPLQSLTSAVFVLRRWKSFASSRHFDWFVPPALYVALWLRSLLERGTTVTLGAIVCNAPLGANAKLL